MKSEWHTAEDQCGSPFQGKPHLHATATETPAQRAAQARFDVDVYPKVAALARRRGMSMATFLRTLALRELALEEETRRQNSAVIIPSEILEVEE